MFVAQRRKCVQCRAPGHVSKRCQLAGDAVTFPCFPSSSLVSFAELIQHVAEEARALRVEDNLQISLPERQAAASPDGRNVPSHETRQACQSCCLAINSAAALRLKHFRCLAIMPRF